MKVIEDHQVDPDHVFDQHFLHLPYQLFPFLLIRLHDRFVVHGTVFRVPGHGLVVVLRKIRSSVVPVGVVVVIAVVAGEEPGDRQEVAVSPVLHSALPVEGLIQRVEEGRLIDRYDLHIDPVRPQLLLNDGRYVDEPLHVRRNHAEAESTIRIACLSQVFLSQVFIMQGYLLQVGRGPLTIRIPWTVLIGTHPVEEFLRDLIAIDGVEHELAQVVGLLDRRFISDLIGSDPERRGTQVEGDVLCLDSRDPLGHDPRHSTECLKIPEGNLVHDVKRAGDQRRLHRGRIPNDLEDNRIDFLGRNALCPVVVEPLQGDVGTADPIHKLERAGPDRVTAKIGPCESSHTLLLGALSVRPLRHDPV